MHRKDSSWLKTGMIPVMGHQKKLALINVILVLKGYEGK